MRALALCAVVLLAGCANPVPQQDIRASEPPRPASSAALAEEAIPAPSTLAGEWKVVAIDQRDLNEPYGIALSATDREIWWEPRCAAHVRGYAISGAAISVGRAPSLGPVPAPGAPPQAVCAIGVPPRLAEVFRTLDAATVIRRTPSNGVEISGGAHALLLFAQ